VILLYKGKSFVSKLIKWQTFGPYSHAAWWLRDGTVIEAWHKGGVTHNDSPATLHTPGTEIDVFSIPGIDDFAVEQFLISQVGRKYDFAPVLRGFIFRVKRDNPDKWFCSELVHAACDAAGTQLLHRVPDWKIPPTLLSYSPLLVPEGTLITRDKDTFDFHSINPSNPSAGDPA
jgi:uncharacterized protein YycO